MAWSLALAPLAFILMEVVLLQMGISTYGRLAFLLPAAVTVLLCRLDSRRLAAVGVDVAAGWALIVPVYLILRTTRAHQKWSIPVVWFAALLAYFASGPISATLGGVELDSGYVEQEIASSYAEYGERVTVVCPDPAIAPIGASIVCEATLATGRTVEVVVTIENAQGWVSWQESL